MKTFIGKIIYYLAWPVVWFIFHDSTRAYVLLESDGEILFVKSWFGSQKWKLPGGGLKEGEDFKAAALRELSEETNIKLQNNDLKLIFKTENLHAGAKYTHIVYISQNNIKPNYSKNKFEIMELAWLKPNQINTKNSDKITIQALKDGGFVPS